MNTEGRKLLKWVEGLEKWLPNFSVYQSHLGSRFFKCLFEDLMLDSLKKNL